MAKFACFVFLEIVNQSIIVKIPQQPKVKSFNTPIPTSPSINLSIPKLPRKIDTISKTVGSFKSQACKVASESGEAFSSFCLKTGIAEASKYFALVVKYKSISFFP